MLSQKLLEKCEDFIDQIVNETRDEDLDFAMGSLRDFLEKDVDGFTSTSKQKLAYAVQCRLEEIWDLVTPEEKKINPEIGDYFDDLMADVEEISEYEAERSADHDENEEDDCDYDVYEEEEDKC